MTDYDAIYRKTHPKSVPLSPWERQRELTDLWPVDQERFKQIVDAALNEKTPPPGAGTGLERRRG